MEEKHAIRVLFFHHGESVRAHEPRPEKTAAVAVGRVREKRTINSFAVS
jgi:hypothetical protein